ncbi:hypothetical protein GTA08_BOTSDO14272 [Botryosphaeria dothidea]|uniref:Uncharacterized protein n=1 Tax=Botryosphaeria dothidea TaxID=55169 RepID=A0A8H4MYX4_9PEZI|nr:hypothetical protein GTA08_BOTSDO14272 [Botryosphaeria dothidea]
MGICSLSEPAASLGFGKITYVKILPTEMAIKQMQGYPIGNSRVGLGGDWSGTTAAAPAKKQFVKPEKPGAGVFKKSLAAYRDFIGLETPNNQILTMDKKQVELRVRMSAAAGREEGLEDKRYGPDQEAG